MGQSGDKTYECDYVEDLIGEYELYPGDRDLTVLDVEEILNEEEGDREGFLGIVSFIIDRWDNPRGLLTPKLLEKALLYAEDLLKDFEYACRWFTNWKDRMEGLEEEMENIHKLLNLGVPFDFSKYEKIEQDSLLDIKNWDRFDEVDQIYVLRYLKESPKPEVVNTLKEVIKEVWKGIGDIGVFSSRLVLAAIVISKIDGQDAINVIFENVDNSFSWVCEAAKEYLTERLDIENDKHIRKQIRKIIRKL